jgi:tetratricopeptide (TPR) repeat protein
VDKRREKEAARLFRKAKALAGEGLHEQAAAAYQQLLQLVPNHAPTWFNLGLAYKRLRRWPDSLRCNRRAAELDPSDEAAWWNMGIAATALHDWPAARAAWRGFGLDLPDGDGPIAGRFGSACMRLNADGQAEVVWGDRLDPARARVASVPLPTSGHRWGDVVLHDGEPKGERTVGGRKYLVFDEIERWQASDIPTLEVQVTAPAPDDSHALAALLAEEDAAGEDWTESVRSICRTCSEGSPCERHGASSGDGNWQPERTFGIAALPEVARDVLGRWAAGRPGRDFGDLSEVC